MTDSKQAMCQMWGVCPGVYEAFERKAFKLWDAGIRNYGGKAIIEVLRYESVLRDGDIDFKINNNATSKIVRVFKSINPIEGVMFKTRERAGDTV